MVVSSEEHFFWDLLSQVSVVRGIVEVRFIQNGRRQRVVGVVHCSGDNQYDLVDSSNNHHIVTKNEDELEIVRRR